jgi:hypothetical protein
MEMAVSSMVKIGCEIMHCIKYGNELGEVKIYSDVHGSL